MNMQTPIKGRLVKTCIDADAVGCLREMLVTTLAIIDELQLPADIGAHLDLTINRLGELIPASESRTRVLALG